MGKHSARTLDDALVVHGHTCHHGESDQRVERARRQAAQACMATVRQCGGGNMTRL